MSSALLKVSYHRVDFVEIRHEKQHLPAILSASRINLLVQYRGQGPGDQTRYAHLHSNQKTHDRKQTVIDEHDYESLFESK
jgi:hypothetical protein